MTLQEFYDALFRLDWWYEMSDDNSKFEAGSKEYRRLERHKNTTPEHRSLWFTMMRWRKHGEGGPVERPNA